MAIITSIEEVTGIDDVYDLCCDAPHAYTSNGFVSHNCVLLDEIDKVFNQNSGGGDSGVGSRILGTLLTFMQENNSGIFWVLTANRVDGLPSELLRKGRLDETFAVTVPDESERLAILEIHLRKRKQDVSKITDLAAAVKASEGYVGAELEAAVKEAVKVSFASRATDKPVAVSGQLIAEQLADMKPLSVAFKAQFDAMNEWADNNARPASLQKLIKANERKAKQKAEPTGSDEQNPVGIGRRRRKLDA